MQTPHSHSASPWALSPKWALLTPLALLTLLALPPCTTAAPAQIHDEQRNSMFETDVNNIQLGQQDSKEIVVYTAQTPAEAASATGQQPQTASPAQTGQTGQTGQSRVAQAPPPLPSIPLGTLNENTAGLELGTSLPKGSLWQLNTFPVPQGTQPQQVYKLSPSAALTVFFDRTTRRAVKINITVVHVPTIYGPQAKNTFEGECLMAVLFGGNLFVDMERNPALAQAMQDRLSLRNTSVLEGKIIDFGLTEAPLLYSARLEGGRYTLDIIAKS